MWLNHYAEMKDLEKYMLCRNSPAYAIDACVSSEVLSSYPLSLLCLMMIHFLLSSPYLPSSTGILLRVFVNVACCTLFEFFERYPNVSLQPYPQIEHTIKD